jgi:serine/threonine protein kinase
LIPDRPAPFERIEFLHAQSEVLVKTGKADPRPALETVLERYDNDQLDTRAILARLLQADAEAAQNQSEQAQKCLIAALKMAAGNGHLDLADRVRTKIVKSNDADDLLDVPGLFGSGSSSPLKRQFILRAVAGRGAFGQVYRATDLADGSEVAIKRFDIGDEFDAQRRKHLIASLRAEYTAASNIQHPGVARLRDLLVDAGGSIYLVQDFIDGTTLSSVLSDATSVELMLTTLANVCQALAHLHAKGIVHRDLKPDNVMIRRNGLPVIIDLGIAHFSNRSNALTRIGTVGFMSPEQAAGVPPEASADIYSLGRMIEEVWNTCRANAIRDMPWWRRLTTRSRMPRPLRECVAGMVSTDPGRRPKSLSDIATILKSCGSSANL